SKENLSKDRAFWLEHGKALFQSSDAHNLDTIGKKFSWIKADPTFEGLKQVTYEPEERINLEETKPDDKPDYQVIDYVELAGDGIWDGRIEFNENLNTIIGGRSTGKSTLLASIAYKLGKLGSENDTFSRHIEGQSASVVLHWKDGRSGVERDVDYFPQNHMHTLACTPHLRNNLIKGIISKKDKDNLLELYRSHASSQKIKHESLISHLFSVKEEVNALTSEIEELGDKAGIEKEIEKLKQKISEFSADFSQDDREAYQKISSQLSELKRKIEDCDKFKSDLPSIKEFDFFTE